MQKIIYNNYYDVKTSFSSNSMNELKETNEPKFLPIILEK